MALAFTRQDPDGNGAADTWGLGSLAGGERVRTDIFEQMFRVPNNWRRNPDGSLTNAVETEEFRGAIAFMRRCWEAGAYHPDALTLTNRQVQDLAYGSRLGAYAGGLGALGNHRRQTRQQTSTADVRPLTPPGHDGGAGVTHKDGGFTNFTAISARAGRDRERARELLRILDWYAAPFGSEEQVFKNNGLEGVHHTVGPNGALEPTEAGRLQISGFPNLAGHPLVFFDPDSPDEAPLLQSATAEMVQLGIDDPTQGLYSPAQASRAGQLDRLQDDRLTAIIAGREPLGALDGFVRDWKSRGGDEIRQELEEALKAQR
jgi:putative aldouronate transport system substrate-binding protein